MKILLVAVNAKYIHSNLAVRSLRAYAGKYAGNIIITELTINHSEDEILKAIYLEKAEVVAFSCYIWNITVIKRIAAQLRKVQPGVKIWFGGPEVSYDSIQILKTNPDLDGIMIGEGEQTFLELAGYYIERNGSLECINGLVFKKSAMCGKGEDMTSEREVVITPYRQPLSLDSIPFPYEDMGELKNRIVYYESSRGCPFSCSYCLSSIDKSVRFKNTELVKCELKFLLEQKVPQIKFVDRTFNCNKKHTMDIWNFVKENDNGITNFHFEISADLLTDEEIDFLASLRPGQIQFEIGVQSTNPETINMVHRRTELDKLKANVARIKAGNNIHQHLDLIAGLPMEDYTSFEQSFNDVYRLKPDQLQLGFLKILKGSRMEKESTDFGIVYRDEPPYEFLYTKHIDFDTVLKLKSICEMVEAYYNSAQFTNSISYLECLYNSPMKLYKDLAEYYERKGLDKIFHSRMRRYEILLDFYKEIQSPVDIGKEDSQEISLFIELLIFDLFLREDLKTRPVFAPANPLQNRHQEIYKTYNPDRKSVHIEQFTYDVTASVRLGRPVKKKTILLFDYSNRDPLSKAASIRTIEL